MSERTLIASSRGVSSLGLVIKTCYCNRDFTVAEVTSIITELRKKDNVRLEQQYNGKDPLYKNKEGVLLIKKGKSGFYNLQGKFVQIDGAEKYKVSKSNFDDLGTTIFQSKEIEKIQDKDANLTTFTKELNKTLTEYTINTCVRKIHFIAQIYLESGRFVDTYEGKTSVGINYKGGVDFQGRGLKQVTHDMNYLEYYDKKNSTTLFKDKYQYKHKTDEGLTTYLARVKKNGFPEGFLDTLKVFAKKLSTELSYACDSSGWFWDSRGINKLADEDSVTKVTNKINGGDNGLADRKKYTADLKIIFDYEKCTNKK